MHLVLITVFGVLLPQRKGMGFLDPVMVSAYACMGVIFCAPAAVDAFARNRPQSMREVFARVGKTAGYGEGFALLLLLAGVITVNLGRRGRMRWPEIDTLAESGLLGIAATIAAALFAGWLTLRFAESTARRGTRVMMVLLLLAFWSRSSRLPEVGLAGAGLCAVISGLMIHLLYREVHPR